MDGVILFADDHVFDSTRNENKLFHKFNSDSGISVLPINSIDVLEKTIMSISTFKAIILDWNFKKTKENDDDDEFVKLPAETPLEFLKKNLIYSLVYIYSENPIADSIQDELRVLYKGKISFETKNNSQDIDTEYRKIIDGVNNSETENKHMAIPFVWSQTINKSAQKIFQELELADSNWIKEIYNTAKNDGAEPCMEVISVFNNLLNESIIQNETLINELSQYALQNGGAVESGDEALAKLYNRIYYTKLLTNTPFMTGDIFKFSDEEYGILFTPECDVNKKKENELEFLLFNKNQIKDKTHKKDSAGNLTEELKTIDLRLFNNGDIAYHILPSFPFEKNKYDKSAFIDFKKAFTIKAKNEYREKRTEFRLNSPYIHQLRQRCLAYMGRVGVPAIPQSLRQFNWK